MNNILLDFISIGVVPVTSRATTSNTIVSNTSAGVMSVYPHAIASNVIITDASIGKAAPNEITDLTVIQITEL